MKDKFMKFLPYIIALVFTLGLIIGDIVKISNIQGATDADIEEYAKGLVESSEVFINGQKYHGLYDSDEVLSIPETFTLVGTTTMIDDYAELTNNCDSHVLPSGYEVYADSNDDSKVYINITLDESPKSYLVYVKDVTDEVVEALEELNIIEE
ncbi:MAG: hypothetical protein MJ245_00775 [Clostridia bacterium]|nr:hypothetical protein [Clostridia bacterium]